MSKSIEQAARKLVNKLYKIEKASSAEAGEGYCFVCDSYVRHKDGCEVLLLNAALEDEKTRKPTVGDVPVKKGKTVKVKYAKDVRVYCTRLCEECKADGTEKECYKKTDCKDKGKYVVGCDKDGYWSNIPDKKPKSKVRVK